MPYQIIQLPNKKFSVINKISRHNFSPKGITKAMAVKQMKALYLHAKDLVGGSMDGGATPYEAMSDTDLRKYFPHAPIVKYSELPQGVPAEDFLKKAGDVAFILYESTLNSGHWVALARGEKAFYYFDSYGNKPAVPLTWNSEETNKELNQDQPTLVKMFAMSKLPVYYNDYPYQSKTDTDVATCGRWATEFLIHFKKYKGDLKSFKTETLKRAGGRDLDKFISKVIDE